MGAGKTTTGRRLASRLSYAFVDLDSLVETEEHLTIAGIFAQKGEIYFREKEAAVLRNIASHDNTVVSTGGGLPCFGDNMAWMNANGITVYLRLSPEALFQRLLHAREERPLIKEKSHDELLEYIRHTLHEREHFYQQCAIIAEGLNINVRSLTEQILDYDKS